MRKFVVACLAWFCALFAATVLPPAEAASLPGETAQLVIEGKRVTPDVPPIIKQGRTLVPIRAVAEGLGARVEWNQATRTATIERDETRIVLQLGNRQARVDGHSVKLDAPPLLHQQRMLLPIRFVGESFGDIVGWDGKDRTVIVNRRVDVRVNGEAPTRPIPVYKRADGVYIALEPLAREVGINPGKVMVPAAARTIDNQTALPLMQAESLIDGEVRWEDGENRIDVKRVNELLDVVAEGEKVSIITAKPLSPQHFTLQGPHRLVIDLPHTLLTDELAEQLADKLSELEQEISEKPAEAGASEADHSTDESVETSDAAGLDSETDKSTKADSEADETAGADSESHSDSEADEHGVTDVPSEQESESDESARTEAEAPLITQIRYSQYSASPATVRIVVELSKKVKYQLEQRPDGVDVKLTPAKTKFRVVIDAGHGGTDPGAKGTAANYEKDFNLSVANRVIHKLKQQVPKIEVIATRTTDVYLTLAERVQIANEAEADLFLSIHANKFTRSETRGTETFYYKADSAELARIVHRHLLSATRFPDRKVKTAPFYVIKNTNMPAVLTETGFMSNPEENRLMMSPEFQDRVAQALVNAIREYYESNR